MMWILQTYPLLSRNIHSSIKYFWTIQFSSSDFEYFIGVICLPASPMASDLVTGTISFSNLSTGEGATFQLVKSIQWFCLLHTLNKRCLIADPFVSYKLYLSFRHTGHLDSSPPRKSLFQWIWAGCSNIFVSPWEPKLLLFTHHLQVTSLEDNPLLARSRLEAKP